MESGCDRGDHDVGRQTRTSGNSRLLDARCRRVVHRTRRACSDSFSMLSQALFLRAGNYLEAAVAANCEIVSTACLCCSVVSPANMGRERISSAAASVSGKSPRFHPLEA